MSDKITFDVKFSIEKEFVDDVLTTAFEGGINYWATNAKPLDGDYKGAIHTSDVLTRGGTIVIELEESIDDDNTLEYTLDLEKFISGLKKYAENLLENDEATWVDAGDIDSVGADMILQYALFGEVVFS